MVASTPLQPGSSGSDEKRMKRMISNRESARRSRMKKQKHVEDLTKEIGSLKRQNNDIVKACEVKEQRRAAIQLENEDLTCEKKALEAYLSSMDVVIDNFLGSEGSFLPRMGIQEPWQVHGPSQQMGAKSSGMFGI